MHTTIKLNVLQNKTAQTNLCQKKSIEYSTISYSTHSPEIIYHVHVFKIETQSANF